MDQNAETAPPSGGDSAPKGEPDPEVLPEEDERRHLKRFVRRRKKIVRALAHKRAG